MAEAATHYLHERVVLGRLRLLPCGLAPAPVAGRRTRNSLEVTCRLCMRDAAYRKRVLYLDPEIRATAAVLLDWLVDHMPDPDAWLMGHPPRLSGGLALAPANWRGPTLARFRAALPPAQRELAAALEREHGFPLREFLDNKADDEVRVIRTAEEVESAAGAKACRRVREGFLRGMGPPRALHDLVRMAYGARRRMPRTY